VRLPRREQLTIRKYLQWPIHFILEEHSSCRERRSEISASLSFEVVNP
jgi:hypothetical protein